MNQVAPSPRTTQASARAAIPARIESDTSLRAPAFSLRGSARNVIPKAFTKQAAASAAVKASSAPAMGNADAGQCRCRAESRQQPLVSQPLADESIQRRQPGDGDGPDEKVESGPRHAPDQAAHFLHVACPRALQHAARAQKQQAFEDPMIERVKEPGDQRQRGELRVAKGAEEQRRSEPHENDADVLDAVIREQALQIVFHQCVQHAQQRGDHAADRHQHPGPDGQVAVKVEEDAGHSVDAGLDHDSRHERGDVAGRNGMRGGQPNVQRNDAGFHAEAEEQQQKRSRAERGESLGPQPCKA